MNLIYIQITDSLFLLAVRFFFPSFPYSIHPFSTHSAGRLLLFNLAFLQLFVSILPYPASLACDR